MAKASKFEGSALSELAAELAKPIITASAIRAMRPEPGSRQRKLEIIHNGPFHGYVCNWCGCRFSNTKIVPNNASLFAVLRISEVQRRKLFDAHVCRDIPQKACATCLSAS